MWPNMRFILSLPLLKREMKPNQAKKSPESVAAFSRWHDISSLALWFCLTDRLPKKGTEIPGTGIFLHREFKGQLSRVSWGLAEGKTVLVELCDWDAMSHSARWLLYSNKVIKTKEVRAQALVHPVHDPRSSRLCMQTSIICLHSLLLIWIKVCLCNVNAAIIKCIIPVRSLLDH